MVETEETSESRDGKGSADNDKPFVWGCPRACLTTWDQARLLVMRGYVRDRTGPIRGDDDYVIATVTGLYVPATYEPEE